MHYIASNWSIRSCCIKVIVRSQLHINSQRFITNFATVSRATVEGICSLSCSTKLIHILLHEHTHSGPGGHWDAWHAEQAACGCHEHVAHDGGQDFGSSTHDKACMVTDFHQCCTRAISNLHIAEFACWHCCRSTRIQAQVVIGTHGTLKNWVSKRALSPDHVRILVLDEADDMLKVLTPVLSERANKRRKYLEHILYTACFAFFEVGENSLPVKNVILSATVNCANAESTTELRRSYLAEIFRQHWLTRLVLHFWCPSSGQ